MEQPPLQSGKRIIKNSQKPHGGLALIILLPLVLIAGGGSIGWLVYWIPHTTFSGIAQYIIGGAILGETLLSLLLLFLILPSYLRFAKTAGDAVELTATKGERYVNALSASSLGYWEYDVTKGEVFMSGSMMSLLGYPDRDKTDSIEFWWTSTHEEDIEGLKRTIEYNFDKRAEPFSIAYRIRRANGEYIWIEDHGKAILDPMGKPIKIAGITQDISNVRRVQEVLESRTLELEEATHKIEAEIQNVRKFKKAVDSSTEAVSITSPDGAIIYVNPAWMTLNGYTDAEALGRNHRMLKSADTKPEIMTALWEKVSAGYAFHSEEIMNKRKDGSFYQAELSIAPIREGEQTLFYVAICQDITLRKEIDRAKTEFVSLASHQLRTPLSAIRWYSEMLLSKYVGELNDKQKQYVKEIYAGNLRMVELVNALLNVSRIDLGTFAIEPEPVSLVEICDSVLLELTPQITERKQTVERIFVDAPAVYNADAKLIRIVFQNFLSNAVKYTQPEGHVIAEISTRENNLYIRVADNGYGIPKAQHAKIFEKLFRADNVRQKDTEGTGLGMYIVKAIVENSGGKIWFDSEEDKGTTFHVYLPIGGMSKKSGMRGLN
jgi:PAS domain S-box-containing protein